MTTMKNLDTSTSFDNEADKATATLYGTAIGDALGMPTQDMTPDQIRADYGEIRGFVDAGPHQYIAAGMRAGTITDDTEQMLIVADLLIQHGQIPPRDFAHALTQWEEDMIAKGSLDLLGPSTKAAIAAIAAGKSTAESGKNGTTNGAAMRIAPIGICYPATNLETLVERVHHASSLTHNTSLGVSAAAAVAAAISAGIDGASRTEAIALALDAARLGQRYGHQVPGPSIAGRLPYAIELAKKSSDLADLLYNVVGTTLASQESVVAALTLIAVVSDPWEGLCLAANCGGDTDTIGAIAGSIYGAIYGLEAFPHEAIDTIEAVNNLNLTNTATKLVARRHTT
ncbi:ADP-ribosylglycohydrolase family protein [Arcanobacterium pinnipediorum]|uniref:ADP-ribosylglycohydrolase family protein n=1 Tax=Arcanobacterium pinnipediorum TaxID=1503041 RepID=A0ABY5AFZ9_9ACTO|nr:ADP-ribosylglycohydrolase family protein [Arcanobacterium pinnipediorum]USR78940.1 ADP-ribosylglycohydrolase family protein [Arcanobacterium pinnipediorum]